LSINITSCHTGSGDVENDGIGDVVFAGAEKTVSHQTSQTLHEFRTRRRS